MFTSRAQRMIYKKVVKPIFFRFDPEGVHDRVLAVGKLIGKYAVSRRTAQFLFAYEHSSLAQNVCGIYFKNPVGLTAGFDKNAELTQVLPAVGFGFAEVGSITGEPCEGNPKPRLWRLPKSQGLVVYYGLKNDGCEAIAARLQKERFAFPVGISIAKTNNDKTVEVDAGVRDYVKAFRAFRDIGDYITINISCPNAFGGEPFTDPERLELLLAAIDAEGDTRPVFLKFPADLSFSEIDALVAVADWHRIKGFIVSNLTKRRDRSGIDQDEVKNLTKGGISGKPVFDPSNELISHLFRTVGSQYVLIGSGGVFTAADAYEKIRRGASLVQLATGMIFEGPQVIGEINRGLVDLLQKDGFTNIREAVGSAH
ncbi:MAG: quinone-dependent dihydroorotate dehydrogenase [bacterium]|nr:quinone-dependent dihydroorotate dehydrogenase [bacterium]